MERNTNKSHDNVIGRILMISSALSATCCKSVFNLGNRIIILLVGYEVREFISSAFHALPSDLRGHPASLQ